MLKKLSHYLIEATRYNDSRIANRIRAKCYKNLVNVYGESIKIKSGVIIKEPYNLNLGNKISIQENCFFSCIGGLEIGDNVSFATGTKIFTSRHPYEYGIIRDNKLSLEGVKIGSNIWVGADTKILAGVIIEDRVVIAAGSVVTKNCMTNGVYAGVPAKLIKKIGNNDNI